MAQLNITLESEILHGLFTSDGRDEAFSKLLASILNQVLDHSLPSKLEQNAMNVMGRERPTVMVYGKGR